MYLQMDGVDDYLRVNIGSLTVDKVVMDVAIIEGANGRLFDINYKWFRASYAGADTYPADWTGVKVNGSPVVSGTDFLPADTRILLEANAASPASTNDTWFFRGWNNADYCSAKVWDVKLYRLGALIAHYDMSTGTVQDQSGNGRHATLVGGTWVSDAPTPVAHTASGSATSTSTATATASRRASATATATSNTTAQAVVVRHQSASGTAVSSSGAEVSARRGQYTSGSCSASSEAIAAMSQGFKTAGLATSVSTAQASGDSGAVHTASGEALSACTASAAVKWSSKTSGASHSTSSASAEVKRGTTASAVAMSQSSSMASSIRRLSAAGAAESFSTAMAMAFVFDPDAPIYKRVIPFKVQIERGKAYKVGIVRKKKYDIKW